MRTERLQGLADNVFAVALTLLALQLPLPRGSRHLTHELTRQWPFYAAYVVSFVTVAIVWINHHALMDRVRQIDRSVLEFNLLLLLFVAVIPRGRPVCSRCTYAIAARVPSRPSCMAL